MVDLFLANWVDFWRLLFLYFWISNIYNNLLSLREMMSAGDISPFFFPIPLSGLEFERW